MQNPPHASSTFSCDTWNFVHPTMDHESRAPSSSTHRQLELASAWLPPSHSANASFFLTPLQYSSINFRTVENSFEPNAELGQQQLGPHAEEGATDWRCHRCRRHQQVRRRSSRAGCWCGCPSASRPQLASSPSATAPSFGFLRDLITSLSWG